MGPVEREDRGQDGGNKKIKVVIGDISVKRRESIQAVQTSLDKKASSQWRSREKGICLEWKACTQVGFAPAPTNPAKRKNGSGGDDFEDHKSHLCVRCFFVIKRSCSNVAVL